MVRKRWCSSHACTKDLKRYCHFAGYLCTTKLGVLIVERMDFACAPSCLGISFVYCIFIFSCARSQVYAVAEILAPRPCAIRKQGEKVCTLILPFESMLCFRASGVIPSFEGDTAQAILLTLISTRHRYLRWLNQTDTTDPEDCVR